MKCSKENLRIAYSIFRTWSFYIIRVLKYQPSSYFPEYISEDLQQPPLLPGDWKKLRKIVKGVHKISPYIRAKRRCLMEALIVYETLRREGILSQFHVGAKKENQSFTTHAWVSIEGQTIIGGPVEEFEELVRTRKNYK